MTGKRGGKGGFCSSRFRVVFVISSYKIYFLTLRWSGTDTGLGIEKTIISITLGTLLKWEESCG